MAGQQPANAVAVVVVLVVVLVRRKTCWQVSFARRRRGDSLEVKVPHGGHSGAASAVMNQQADALGGLWRAAECGRTQRCCCWGGLLVRAVALRTCWMSMAQRARQLRLGGHPSPSPSRRRGCRSEPSRASTTLPRRLAGPTSHLLLCYRPRRHRPFFHAPPQPTPPSSSMYSKLRRPEEVGQRRSSGKAGSQGPNASGGTPDAVHSAPRPRGGPPSAAPPFYHPPVEEADLAGPERARAGRQRAQWRRRGGRSPT